MDWGPAWALGGVAVGGGIGILADSIRWRRSVAVKWDSPRREACTAFLGSVLKAHRWWAVRVQSESQPDLVDSPLGTLDEVINAAASLNLVASEAVKSAADLLLSALSDVVQFARLARGRLPRGTWLAHSDPSFGPLQDRFVGARIAFERAVRAEIKIP